MIYISDANTEYLKYTMGEEKQDFIEVNRIEMARKGSDNDPVDADDLMAAMDKNKTLDLNIFSKILQSIKLLQRQAWRHCTDGGQHLGTDCSEDRVREVLSLHLRYPEVSVQAETRDKLASLYLPIIKALKK